MNKGLEGIRVPYGMAVHDSEEEEAVLDVIRNHKTIIGEKVKQFEKDIARKNPINKKSGIVFCFFVIKYNETNIKKSGVISFNTIIDRNAIFALTAKNNCVSSATFLSKRFFVIKYERNTIPVPPISEIIFPAVNASPSRLPRVA